MSKFVSHHVFVWGDERSLSDRLSAARFLAEQADHGHSSSVFALSAAFMSRRKSCEPAERQQCLVAYARTRGSDAGVEWRRLMQTRIVTLVASVAVALALPWSASAAPVLWELSGVTFLDGVATATGSFVFDAATNAVSAVNITTDPGPGFTCSDPPTCSAFSPVLGAFAGATFDLGFAPSAGLVITVRSADLPDLTGSTVFQMVFSSPLTDAGGTIPLVSNAFGEYICTAPSCDTFDIATDVFRTMSGSVTAVPEPATVTLLVLGGAVSALVRRRRRTQ
jgi:hypothetical protein